VSGEQRVVAILGAGGSLGGAITRKLAGESLAGLVVSDRSVAALEDSVAGVEEGGPPVETVIADVTERGQVDAVVARAVERFGRLDVFISNAGIPPANGRIHNLSDDDWERAFRVNVMGHVHAIQSAVPVMRHQEQGGALVLTASVAGLTAWAYAAAYCATKAAVIELAKVAAVEYARDNIRVNCVCPGTFVSAMHAELPPSAVEDIAERHPLGLGSPDDLVGAYSYLASDAARWTTGSAMIVDGGYSAP